MLDVVCTHCGKTLKIPEKYIGQKGKCNNCQAEITVKVTPQEFTADMFEAEGNHEMPETTTLQDLLRKNLRPYTRGPVQRSCAENQQVRASARAMPERPPVPQQAPMAFSCPRCRVAMVPVQRKRAFSISGVLGLVVLFVGLVATLKNAILGVMIMILGVLIGVLGGGGRR